MHRRPTHHRYCLWLISAAVGIGFVVLNSFIHFRESKRYMMLSTTTTTPSSDAVSLQQRQQHIERKCTKAVEKLVSCKFCIIYIYPRQCGNRLVHIIICQYVTDQSDSNVQ